MKKIIALLATIILCANMITARPPIKPDDEPNTDEEMQRLSEIFAKLKTYVNIMRPYLERDLNHLSELNNVRFTYQNYNELFASLYPRTTRELAARSAKHGKSSARGKSSVVTGADGFPVGSLGWLSVGIIETVKAEITMWQWWDKDIETSLYNDMVARGVPEDLAMKEANYQSDMIASDVSGVANLMLPLGGLALAISQIEELVAEANDNMRYNLKDYFARSRAGRDKGIGNRHPLPVGGDSPYGYFFGTPGGGRTPGDCLVIGPGPMPGGEPGEGLPRFDGGTIGVTATPLDPCH